MKRFMAAVFSLLLMVALGGTLAFAGNDKITLYISGPKEMINALEKQFEAKRGDVLDVFATGCGPLKQKVWTEMLAGGIQADLIWGAEPMLYYALQQKGVLQQYRSPQAKNLQKQYNYGNGYFTPVNARYGVIVYNTAKTSAAKAPRAWRDLTKKCWDKKLAMADAAQSAMALALAVGLYDVSGGNWNLVKAYNVNHLILTKTNVDAIAKVESGEAWAGIAPHDGVLRLVKKAKKKGVPSPLRLVWPAEGAISVQRPIAIIKKRRSAKLDRLAREFVDFSLSEPAQRIAARFAFITVCNGLPLPDGVPDRIKAVTLNWETIAKQETQFMDGFTQIMTVKLSGIQF
ncbi:MAG: ABC transporter substrate-binding protein [Bacillota bacterium]|jgi:iron(III) transport system substrate-binding protein